MALASHRRLLRNYVWNYLLDHPCETCGEEDPIVLDFDHLDPKAKRRDISKIIGRKESLATLRREIDKCRVLCSNCHRKHEAKVDRSWRWKYSQREKRDGRSS